MEATPLRWPLWRDPGRAFQIMFLKRRDANYHYGPHPQYGWHFPEEIPVKTSTGNNFPRKKPREIPEIITSTGAKLRLRFCLSILVLVMFLVHTPSTAGTFRKKFRKNSGKTPETLSERFLEFPSRVRLGCPKLCNSKQLRLPEHFQNYLPPSTAGGASFFRSGSGEGLPERVMEFPAVLGVFLTLCAKGLPNRSPGSVLRKVACFRCSFPPP